ncbi:MAG: universal stress protein, partial [Duncaniella sp.]|nr:universal stress protein [Duncaniella sp.]
HNARVIVIYAYLDPGLMDASSFQLSDSLSFPSASTEMLEVEEAHADERIANERMEKFADELRTRIASSQLPDVKFDTIVSEGLPEEVISQANSKEHPLLIVMGSNSDNEERRALTGSIAGEVLNAAESTILTLPLNTTVDLTSPLHVAFFSNSRQDDILALDTFARLFPKVKIDVTLVELPSRRGRNGEGGKNLLDYCRENFPEIKFESMSLSSDHPEADFEHLNEIHPVDFIVTPNRRKNVIARLFSPTLAHRLLFRSSLPLLAISLE